MMRKDSSEEQAVPEHLQCNRTDGKKWQCRRLVMGNLKWCEIHHLQQLHRNRKEKVPASLKLRSKKKHEINNHIAADDFKNSNKMKMKNKKPNLSSDGNHVNVNDMEGEGEGEGSGSGSTTVDITGYDLKNRICKLEKLIAKLKAAKLASKA